MRRILLLTLLAMPGLAYAEDYVFFHNNDSISMRKAGGEVAVQVCSISNKSAFEFVCNGNDQLKWINSSDGWKSYSCPLGTNYSLLNIMVRETGAQGKSGTVGPANSDMVVRVSDAEVTQVQGRDTKSSADANKCK